VLFVFRFDADTCFAFQVFFYCLMLLARVSWDFVHPAGFSGAGAGKAYLVQKRALYFVDSL
jgi:hypothetical protein